MLDSSCFDGIVNFLNRLNKSKQGKILQFFFFPQQIFSFSFLNLVYGD